MAAQRGDLGRPHARRAAADHHDPLLPQRRLQMVLALGGLRARRRVLHAADGLVQPHAAVAVLVAGDAVADLLGAPFPSLHGEVGIADLAAHHADHVSLALGQHPLGQGRVVDAPRGEDRQRGHRLDAGRQRDRVAERQMHRAAHQVEVVEGGEGEVEVVHKSGGLDPLGDLLGVLQIEAAGDELVGAQAHAQGEVGARRAFRTAVDHLEGKAHAIVEAAPVLVAAEVGERRHELPRQGAVPELQLHAVEPALANVHGRPGEVLGDLADVLDLHGLGRLPVEHVRDGRGRPHRQAGEAAAALLAVVVELGEDAGVVPVDFPGELLVAGDDLRMEGLDQVLVGPVGGVHRLLLGDDEPRAAASAGRQGSRSAARWAARCPTGW